MTEPTPTPLDRAQRISQIAGRTLNEIADVLMGVSLMGDLPTDPQARQTIAFDVAVRMLRSIRESAVDLVDAIGPEPAGALETALAEIVAEGHTDVDVYRYDWMSGDEQWGCKSSLGKPDLKQGATSEEIAAWIQASESGEAKAATPGKAAKARLDAIRALRAERFEQAANAADETDEETVRARLGSLPSPNLSAGEERVDAKAVEDEEQRRVDAASEEPF